MEIGSITWRARCLEGEFQLFNEVIQQYQHPLYLYIRKMVGNAAVAQELTQDTLVRAFEKVEQFDPQRSLRSWLFSIAHNLSVDWQRHQRFEIADAEIIRTADALNVAAVNPEQLYSDCQQQEQLSKLLDELQPAVRQVLLMHYTGGLKVREIAEALQLPIGTVLAHLSRGRNRLQNLLAAAKENV